MAFLLVTCVTGLPLIFKEAIGDWLEGPLSYADVSGAHASLDRIVSTSRELYPDEVIVAIVIDDDEPKMVVTMAPSWDAFNNGKSKHRITFDARTAQVLKQSKPIEQESPTFLGIMLSLHKDLFAGLAGELLMAFIGLLFVAAVVSGVVIYGPFMRKLQFGTVRGDRSIRLKWLDLHNLLGVATIAWALMVGATGIMNELTIPLFKLWQKSDVRMMLEPFKGKALPEQSDLSSPQAALVAVQKALPEKNVFSIIFPGAEFGSPYHYLVWSKGQEPLTSRLFTPMLIDARSGAISGIVSMPWYLRALQVSRPLHFGNYGGLPLKVIWALLDIVTILVLGSGFYLWFSRKVSPGADEEAEIILGRDQPADCAPVEYAAE
jgi:uncharacterized iron-regulated membrane protein